MKTLLPFIALLLTFGVTSCSDDDAQPVVEENITVQSLTNTLVNHSDWRITEFYRDGIDYDEDFEPAMVSFAENNAATISLGAQQTTGSWLVFAGEGTNNPNTPAMLTLNFSTVEYPEFAVLNQTWLAIERTGNFVRLRSVDGPDYDYIALSRN